MTERRPFARRLRWHAAAAAVGLILGCDKLSQLTAGDVPKEQQARQEMTAAKVAATKGDLEGAVRHYEAAAALTPTDPWPALQLGDLYARLGNEPQSILSYKRAVELAPNDIEARKRLADLYSHQGNADLAAQMLKDAQKLAPEKDIGSRRKLAKTLLASGQIDEAEQELQKIVADDPSDGESVAMQAEIFSDRGDDERALKLFDAALTLSPEAPGVRLARQRYFQKKGQLEQALNEVEAAAKAAPEDSELIVERANLLARLKRYPEAKDILEALAKRRPTDLTVQAGLADVLVAAGDLPAAKTAAEAVLSRQPHNARALYARARAIEEQGDDERAVAAYRAALEADPEQSESLSHMAALALKMGKNSDAMAALERLYLTKAATPAEEVDLASVYVETGIDLQRASRIVDDCLKRSPVDDRCEPLKKKLGSHAAGDGPKILKGKRH